MVDIAYAYLGSHTIQSMLCSEFESSDTADSGIISDYNSDGDAASLEEEVDYSKRLQEAMR